MARRTSMWTWVVAVATAALTTVSPATAEQARAQDGWHSWPLPGDLRNQELRGVGASGPTNVWAVGYQEMASRTNAPVARKFDGRAWRTENALGHGGVGEFEDVLPLSDHDVWAVGHWDDAPATQDRALANHFDGRVWREVALPAEPRDRSVYPYSVAGAGPDDVWIVGTTAQDRIVEPRPLAYHWDGRTWRSVPTPDTGGDALLLDVTTDRGGGVWAVGVAYDAQGAGRPLTEYWDGLAWCIVEAPAPPDQGSTLEGVTALAPDDVWAVGSSSPPDQETSTPLTYHWDGSSWTSVPTPPLDMFLSAVSADPRGGVWAVGERQGVDTPATILRWDGRQWIEVPAASDQDGEGASLFDVVTVPDSGPGAPSAWTVGSTLPRLQIPWRPIMQGYGARPGSDGSRGE